jgi:modulator of FtsH protease
MSFNFTTAETYDNIPVAQAPAEVRGAFLNKVYMTLCVGLAISMGVAFYILNMAINGDPALMTWLIKNRWLVFFGYLAMAFAAGGVARRPGINIILFGAFTVATGLLLAPMFAMAYMSTESMQVIWNAFGLTALVFGGLTSYVLVTGKNFSAWGGFLFVGLLILIGAIIATFFFSSPVFQLAVTCAGLLLFAGFVLFDTSQILHSLSHREWVAGALTLFIDFINMFIRILSLMSGRR